MGLLTRGKALVEWGGAIWTVLGWLGLASLVGGLGISIGGAVWAVIVGTPIPIAVMVAFCAFVAAVYLALAPMAFRAMGRVGTTEGATAAQIVKRAPDYEVWRHVEILSLRKAACLWSGCDPNAELPASANAEVEMWIAVLKDAVKRDELPLVVGQGHNDSRSPADYATTTRTALRGLAKKRGWDPLFLRNKP